MHNAILKVPSPINEPERHYGPGSIERKNLKAKLREMFDQRIEIPLIIGGKEVRTGQLGECRCPHDHGHVLAVYHKAGPREVQSAIDAALQAFRDWSDMPWPSRAAVFLKAADLLSRKYRDLLNAATMLNQSKNVHQSEIDAACELIDFWRYNVYYMTEIYREQPYSTQITWNLCDYRALEGFVFAVSPFNFTSIAGNLTTSPAVMGNVVVWKPASTAVYSGYFLMKILLEAGLPEGVINFIPGNAGDISDGVLSNSHLAGIHFTGSTGVFQDMWRMVGTRIGQYRNYPRIVGETGGKDFVFCHASADPVAVATAIIRGAFEYQGQKCSAASRAYIPDNIWPQIRTILMDQIRTIRMGDVMDFGNYMNAVIDQKAFVSITSYIDHAKQASDAEILIGGQSDNTHGYFIEPTVVLTTNPLFRTMQEEIFGPVMTIYVYPEKKYGETLKICDETSPYGLTGSIFAQDRQAVMAAYRSLRYAAGNFYINDKPTAAVVGQQPFGGARASGTNDKAGSKVNLMRWVNIRTVKETFVSPTDYRYAFMQDEPES